MANLSKEFSVLFDRKVFLSDEEHLDFIRAGSKLGVRMVPSRYEEALTVDHPMSHYGIGPKTFVYGAIPFCRSTMTRGFEGNFLRTVRQKQPLSHDIYFLTRGIMPAMTRLAKMNKCVEDFFLNHDLYYMCGDRYLDILSVFNSVKDFVVYSYDHDLLRRDENGDTKIFIRANSPYKAYPSQCVNIDELLSTIEKEYLYSSHGFAVANYKPIQHELRTLVYENRVVDASYYIVDGEISYEYYDGSFAVFNDLIRGSTVLPLTARINSVPFIVDFAFSDGRWTILEINSVSSSGLYKIDKELYLKTIASSMGFDL